MSSAQTSSFSSDDDNKLHAGKSEPLPSYEPLSPPECPQTDSEDGHQLPRLNLSRSASPDESLPPRSPSEPDEAVPVDQRDGRRSSSDTEEEHALFEEIVARVRRRHHQEDDDSDGPGRTYILHGQEALDRLLDRLGKHHLLDFFQTAIRWNWNADTGRLDLLLMAEAIHEVFKDGLTFLIKDKLNALAEGCLATQQIVQKLHSGGHSRVGTARKRWQRYPDGQFKYAGHVDPPFIYEIAHTETEHSLSESVDEYMRFRAEEIGGMLAINITYNRLRLPDFQYTAWYSLYSTSEDGNDLVQKRLSISKSSTMGRPGQVNWLFPSSFSCLCRSAASWLAWKGRPPS